MTFDTLYHAKVREKKNYFLLLEIIQEKIISSLFAAKSAKLIACGRIYRLCGMLPQSLHFSCFFHLSFAFLMLTFPPYDGTMGL